MTGPQITRAELATMSDAEVVKARREGRLDSLLTGKDPADADTDDGESQLSLADLDRMGPEQIVAAHRAGRLEHLKATYAGYSPDSYGDWTHTPAGGEG